MAHPSKFVSVNLNKSYGQRSSSSSSSAFGHGRARHGLASGGGGGGGMVVLSRPRSSGSAAQKGPPKLSVPPPLNLPSLRKEHERFDSSSVPGASARPGSSGFGSGSSSTTMGWTKPGIDQQGGGQYTPPGTRAAGQLQPAPSTATAVEKAVFLRGEDFPSLRATVASGPKQKDAVNQKQKQKLGSEEAVCRKIEQPELESPLDMRPQMRSSRLITSSVPEKDESSIKRQGAPEQPRKQDGYFPAPLPLVRLSHTSDWADDERDTGLSIPERERDHGYSRTDPARFHDVSDGGNVLSKEFVRGDTFGRDVANPSRESRDASSWRAQQPREASDSRDKDRNCMKPYGVNREMNKDTNLNKLPHTDNGWNDAANGLDARYSRRDLRSGTTLQNGRNLENTFSGRTADWNQHTRYGDLSGNRYRDSYQNHTISRGFFSSGSKGFLLNDPILNFSREKRITSNSGKPYLEDAGLDSNNPFSGGLMGEVNVKMFKRKKDVVKSSDLHDPARESFEAELERVQRMQEMERQRVMEEQARVLELARREREERERLAREEEDCRRRIEEEAREAAWRLEHERLEAARRAEEQKIAREEERKKVLLEEERRKEAARKKLLDLEARIAKRQSEANQKGERATSTLDEERMHEPTKDRDVLRVADVEEWEDSERMVENITSATSYDSSSMNRYFETGSRPQSSRDGNSSFVERGKHATSWRRDTYENGSSSVTCLHDQDNNHHSSKPDAFLPGRSFSRKEFHGNLGTPIQSPYKGGILGPSQAPEDFHHPRGSRWKAVGDDDYFNRNSKVGAEFLDNDKLGDGIWELDSSHGSPHTPYVERSYRNPDIDGFTSSGRSRHSLRQPRVLPPPSVSSIRKSPYAASAVCPNSSLFFDSEVRYQPARKSEGASDEHAYQEEFQQPETTASLLENTITLEQKDGKNSLRCDSQSSLSVSSPPSSPTQLSHDDLDESENSQVLPTSAVRKHTIPSANEHVVSSVGIGNANPIASLSSTSHGEDDEWTTGNRETIQEQEEYEEDGGGYREEEEAHEANDVNAYLAEDFEEMQLDVADTSEEADRVVLGFDEGVEVSIPINDDFERTSRNSETIEVQIGSISASQLVSSGGDMSKTESIFPEENVSETSKMINETEQALQDFDLEPVAATSYAEDTVQVSSSSGMPAQHPPPSDVNSSMPSMSSAQPIASSVSNMTGQPEVPIKLQFGLFSGPSLIPSPVPAIQIGSIQMPLHLHPPVGSPISHLHPSQPPFFQFGQMRYTSPVSHGILPLAPQTVSFVQPSAPVTYSLNQNLGGNAHNQSSHISSPPNSSGKKLGPAPIPVDKQSSVVTKPFLLPQDSTERRLTKALQDPLKTEAYHSQTGISSSGEVKNRFVSAFHGTRHSIRDANPKNYRPVVTNKESNPTQFVLREKASNGSMAQGMVSGSRGKKFASTVRNAGVRSMFSGPETRAEPSGFPRRPRRNVRRTEFRVRENSDRRQVEAVESQDGKSNFNTKVSGNPARYGSRKDAVLSRSAKTTTESENINSSATSSPLVISDAKMDKPIVKEASKKRMSSLQNSHAGEENIGRNVNSEEDVDSPLQSGVVRVFKQSGIEAPSDEDDFIQVRSKRQMLNDRRVQREKEIKAKSRVIKAPRKQRAVSQSNTVTSNSNKAVSAFGVDKSNKVHSNSVMPDGRGLVNVANIEGSPVFAASLSSQSLLPVGMPAVNVDSNSNSKILKSCQTNAPSAIRTAGTDFRPGLPLENKTVVHENASISSVSWATADLNQQLDEAMQTARFESHANPSIAHENVKPALCSVMQVKTFPSASPLNSLLAGEKIQFGAVTSPTILPPVSRPVSNGIGPPGSGRSDATMASKMSGTDNDCTAYFAKEKQRGNICGRIVHPEAEAEAEAAASAVAVAAISNSDEVVGNPLGGCSASVSATKSFSGSDTAMLTSKASLAASQEIMGRAAAEEPLTVALPADLSVETSSLPFWPPLPSPQSSPAPMLSHFPALPPSHFPCFEMNPMLGGPIFAFGPHDESVGTQGQPQRNTALGSGPVGPWPQCHPTMDSFYGPPAGFTGPFISPPGGIPGVQGPHHMVVYNHFTPVGQFGQVGLSFMGTTYIPTGKQTDWKHKPVPSTIGGIEGDISNLNVSGQCNPASIPSPIQHMPPGSTLMPIASPLTMFDMSPFQSADMPLQARWSHVPAPPMHSVPLSFPLQQHTVDAVSSQFSRVVPEDTSAGTTSFSEPHSSITADEPKNLPVQKDLSPRFPAELVQVEPKAANTGNVKTSGPSSSLASGNYNKGGKVSKSSANTVASASQSGSTGISSISSIGPIVGPVKTQAPQQLASSSQQHQNSTGYLDQRGSGVSQKAGSGGEWHRRTSYQGRNQSSGPDKNFASSKVKQIYVAKAATSGTAPAS